MRSRQFEVVDGLLNVLSMLWPVLQSCVGTRGVEQPGPGQLGEGHVHAGRADFGSAGGGGQAYTLPQAAGACGAVFKFLVTGQPCTQSLGRQGCVYRCAHLMPLHGTSQGVSIQRNGNLCYLRASVFLGDTRACCVGLALGCM